MGKTNLPRSPSIKPDMLTSGLCPRVISRASSWAGSLGLVPNEHLGKPKVR